MGLPKDEILQKDDYDSDDDGALDLSALANILTADDDVELEHLASILDANNDIEAEHVALASLAVILDANDDIELEHLHSILDGNDDVELEHLGNLDSDGDGKVDNADQLDGNDAGAFADSGHTHGHGELDDVSSDDHHSKYTDSEAVNAVGGQMDVVTYTGDGTTSGRTIGLGTDAEAAMVFMVSGSPVFETAGSWGATDQSGGSTNAVYIDGNGDLVVGDGSTVANQSNEGYVVVAWGVA